MCMRRVAPEKNLGELDIVLHVYPSMCVYVHSYYGNESDMPAHAQAMCTRPFYLLPSKKGLDTRLMLYILTLA